MRLTWRDGVTTILAGCTVAIAMAVAQGWGWPLLGSVAAGVAVLGAVGLAMCVLGASTDSAPSLKDPFTAVMSVLGLRRAGSDRGRSHHGERGRVHDPDGGHPGDVARVHDVARDLGSPEPSI